MQAELWQRCPRCGREWTGAPGSRCSSCTTISHLVLLCDVCGDRLEGSEVQRCIYCERSVGDGGLTES